MLAKAVLDVPRPTTTDPSILAVIDRADGVARKAIESGLLHLHEYHQEVSETNNRRQKDRSKKKSFRRFQRHKSCITSTTRSGTVIHGTVGFKSY